jgi:hypothetical protein
MSDPLSPITIRDCMARGEWRMLERERAARVEREEAALAAARVERWRKSPTWP